MANTSPRHMPVLGNVHPIKIENFNILRVVISLLAWVFTLLIDTEVPMKNIWKKLSIQFLKYAIELLHVKRRIRDKIFFDDFISNINCGIGVLHVWRIFCDVISLLAQVFIVSVDRAYKEVSTKIY